MSSAVESICRAMAVFILIKIIFYWMKHGNLSIAAV